MPSALTFSVDDLPRLVLNTSYIVTTKKKKFPYDSTYLLQPHTVQYTVTIMINNIGPIKAQMAPFSSEIQHLQKRAQL